MNEEPKAKRWNAKKASMVKDLLSARRNIEHVVSKATELSDSDRLLLTNALESIESMGERLE